MLERLLRAGVDVIRLNFSHGEPEEHLEVIRAAREIALSLDQPLALLQDLSGPKIRTGKVDGGAVELKDGAPLRITVDDVVGTSQRISTTYAPLAADVKAGDKILLDDGNLELKVEGVTAGEVDCRVVHGGALKSHKGMNLPGVALSTPALTEKDRRDLAFGVANGVDYVALSFVRKVADVVETKELIKSLGGTQRLIAKIEKREAIDDLPAILEAADGVMVARGDLGVELSTEEVPVLQKKIIDMANGTGKAVITATQMLESMIDNPRPTRAEASDVANAILDGTDAVMLSAESAAGKYPVEAVETMARIARYTEAHQGPRALLALDELRARVLRGPHSAVARSLARVASSVAEELDCRLIVAFTESGVTAELLSCYRPKAPILAVTYHEATYRRLALWWGVVPVMSAFTATTDEMILKGEAVLKERGLAAPGETIVMLAGQRNTAGATNMLRVHTVR
jgi:pyruvate kinase